MKSKTKIQLLRMLATSILIAFIVSAATGKYEYYVLHDTSKVSITKELNRVASESKEDAQFAGIDVPPKSLLYKKFKPNYFWGFMAGIAYSTFFLYKYIKEE